VFQLSLDPGEVPNDRKKALVVYIIQERKVTPSKPVSLMSITGKALEHIVYSSIMKHFDKNMDFDAGAPANLTWYSPSMRLPVRFQRVTRCPFFINSALEKIGPPLFHSYINDISDVINSSLIKLYRQMKFSQTKEHSI